jgi:hypothetical protein
MARTVQPDRAVSARLGWWLAAVCAGLAVAMQLWGLYRPTAPGTPWFPGADKVWHAVGFALPVILIALAYALRGRADGRRPKTRVLMVVAWVFVAHAVLSELIQHAFYADRDGDPLDVLADWSGITAGALLVWLVARLRAAPRG